MINPISLLKSAIFKWAISKVNNTYWPLTWFGTSTDAGVRVTPGGSMQVAAVYACVKVIAETLCCAPIHVYRWTDGGKNKENADNHWLYRFLHDSPNPLQTAFEFLEMMQGHVLLRGNSYAEVYWGGDGLIQQMVPRHPDRVRIEKTQGGDLRYIVRSDENEREYAVPMDRMFHLRGLSSDGVMGLSPIEQQAESIGVSMATQKFAASFYKNGANLGSVLSHPKLLGEKGQKNLRESLAEYQNAENSHKTLILEEDMKWQQLGVPPEQAQFLETQKFNRSQIAGMYRVPPHKIGDLERATFSNIENQDIGFVKDCMLPWFLRWEQAINKFFLADEPEYFVKFQIAGLLRGDILSRFQAYQIAVSQGCWMTRNEVRELEDLNPIEGLDEPLQPLNMTNPGEETTETIEPGQEDEKQEIHWGVLALEVAGRIVAAESREYERHPDKQKWAESFYPKHLAYIAKTLDPYWSAFGLLPLSDYSALTAQRLVLSGQIPNYDELRTSVASVLLKAFTNEK